MHSNVNNLKNIEFCTLYTLKVSYNIWPIISVNPQPFFSFFLNVRMPAFKIEGMTELETHHFITPNIVIGWGKDY